MSLIGALKDILMDLKKGKVLHEHHEGLYRSFTC